MNCDAIARWYRWLESAAFGTALQRRRIAFLEYMAAATDALVLGDGDGRFLRDLLFRAPILQVDAVENSGAMAALAKARAGDGAARVHFHSSDARSLKYQPVAYDLIVTHFFLDCFSDDELSQLAPRLAASAKPGALWVVSEFSIPQGGLARLRAQIWIKLLYMCFGWATGLRVRRLPDYRRALRAAGFRLEREQFASWGLLTSQLWRKSD